MGKPIEGKLVPLSAKHRGKAQHWQQEFYSKIDIHQMLFNGCTKHWIQEWKNVIFRVLIYCMLDNLIETESIS